MYHLDVTECTIPPLGTRQLQAKDAPVRVSWCSRCTPGTLTVYPRRRGAPPYYKGRHLPPTLTRRAYETVESYYINSTSISCTVPHGGEGNTTVGVASNGIDFVGDISFSYAPSLVIEKVHPRRGSTGVDVVIQVRGSINNHATCTFGSVVVAALPQNGSLVCPAPALPLGSHRLWIAPDGGLNIKAGHFTATEPLIIKTLKPSFVYENGGGVISVEGQGFTRGLHCRVGEMESMKTQHVSSTEVVCPTPSAKPGT